MSPLFMDMEAATIASQHLSPLQIGQVDRNQNLRRTAQGETQKMREIKFRGWHAEKQAMFSLGEDQWDAPDYECLSLNDMIQKMSERGWVLMQFTGLKDRNGKEIYEGDILRSPTGYYYVKAITVDGFHGYRFMYGPSVLTQADGDGEVFGNIYENPELLK